MQQVVGQLIILKWASKYLLSRAKLCLQLLAYIKLCIRKYPCRKSDL